MVDQHITIDDLEQGVWAALASHARPLEIYSPDIHEQVDTTDERLQSLYDCFDRDFDGRLSKSELLQGLAQQGFTNLEGTRAFDLLWDTCEKIDRSVSPRTAETEHEQACITFATFKRLVQRLKIELLFLTELHGAHAPGFLSPPSRASTPSLDSQNRRHLHTVQSPPMILTNNEHLSVNLVGRDMQAPDYGSTGESGPVEEWRREPVRFSSVDYSARRFRAEVPVADTYRFFTEHRDSSTFTMRWLHLEGVDRLTILRFSCKYSLHALAVEDALKLEDQNPKVNQYGAHLFVVVPFFRLSHESLKALEQLRKRKKRQKELAAKLNKCRRSAKEKLEGMSEEDDFDFVVEASKLCFFVAGPPCYDTVISIHSKWEGFNTTEAIEYNVPSPVPTAPSTPGRTRSGDNTVALQTETLTKAMPHCFGSIVNALKVDYSILRNGCSRQLLYRLLDEAVDHLLPITRAYRMKVEQYQTKLRKTLRWDNQDLLEDVITMRVELQRLHRHLRPMTSVVRHLMDDPQVGGVDVRVYLEDVQEHVIRSLEEIASCIEGCDSIRDESRSLREQRTNEVLYTLTIITTVFVPLQFITGVYGMNFVNREGTPTMPELLWHHGYLMFWVVALVIFVVLMVYFKFIKRWI